MKTIISFIIFSILISLYVRDVVCPFVPFVSNILETGDVIGVITQKGDPKSKQYCMVTESLMPLQDIVEHLSVGNSDYLEKVEKLIEDKLLEEWTLAYAKDRLFLSKIYSNEKYDKNITEMEMQDLMRYQ
ncbi:uncharacterized protein LOC126838851 isoform X2 [Adelges cooleyi]|uniref:uncharacterized protein LOC126838851 isoform X2 n=1 Tax=Adelges cooleyi TaxID=133065 RepID=UPI00217F443F|nr:uncharacterized protein LOC126838851 isoform X2 [Adelges cooleyi]